MTLKKKMLGETAPETLFYYCSLETFLNIIEKKTVWLCELGKSNDALEQKYFAKLTLEKFDELIKPCNK